MTRKHASGTGGGETPGEGAHRKRAGGGSTSTTQPISQKSLEPQEVAALGLGPTGVRPAIRPDVPHTTPSVVLGTAEQQDAFCIEVVQQDGVKAAARAWGMQEGAVFYWANSRPEFRAKLNVAMSSAWEKQGHALNELLAQLLDKPPKEMNLCANAYGRVVDYRLRILGNLNRTLYGERQAAQVNVQTNVGLVCDEETRARLIQLNQKLLTTAQPKQIEQ